MNPFKLSWFHMIPADFLSPMFSLTFQEGWDLTGYKSVYLIIPGILQIAPSLRIYSTNMYQHPSIFLVFHNLYIMVQWQWKLDPSSINVYIYISHIRFAIQPCIILWNLCQLLNSNAILGRRPTAWLNHQKLEARPIQVETTSTKILPKTYMVTWSCIFFCFSLLSGSKNPTLSKRFI